MKTIAAILLVLLVCSGRSQGQTVVQQFSAVSSGAGTVSDMDLQGPTNQGSVLIAMPLLLTPGVKVIGVTDNAPDGGNTYKQIQGSVSSCAQQTQDIWYCENCKAGVTELKFHLSGHVMASINAFLEVAGLELKSVVDGNAVHLSDVPASKAGLAVGPAIVTTARDFIIARYFSDAPLPTGVTPETWRHAPSYVYAPEVSPGTHQPTLTGAKAGGNYCMSMAAFKIATVAAKAQ